MSTIPEAIVRLLALRERPHQVVCPDIVAQFNGGCFHADEAERAVRADLRDTKREELEEQKWQN